MPIESGTVVTLALTVEDVERGKVLQSFSTEDPTAYLHGYDNLVATLEAALEGLSTGESFDLTAEDAYGTPSGMAPQEVPKREFPRKWNLQPGTAFFAQGSDGQQIRLYVHEVRGSRVTVSADHPWAGRTIRFSGEILHTRNATESEREHGHAHGPGGHHH
jgi:FKBP-type peptidyl-prolyl cis-trans isomerase SlyD